MTESPTLRTLQEIEREAIRETLEAFQGNKTHAARALGISLRGLRLKLHAYSLYEFIKAPAVRRDSMDGSGPMDGSLLANALENASAGEEEGIPALRRSIRRSEAAAPEFKIDQFITRIEEQIMLTALELCGNNKAYAAEMLGLKRTTLVERLRLMGMVEARPRRGLEVTGADLRGEVIAS